MVHHLPQQFSIKNLPSYYTPAQVAEYLERIGFDPIFGVDYADAFTPSLQILEQIMKRHLLTFPWENTAMHYTKDHWMDVTPEGVFRRFLDERKGSYCFGHNILLLGILRGLGFKLYPGAARVNIHHRNPDHEPVYTELTHMVLFVQPILDSKETFVVDVGFGTYNLAQPVPLSEDVNATVPGAYEDLTSTTGDVIHSKWNLEVSQKGEPGWKRLYTFTEEEFSLLDYDSASFIVAQKPNPGPFWNSVLCSKYFEDGPRGNTFQLLLAGKELRKRGTNGAQVVRTIQSDRERIGVLAQEFGVFIDQDDIKHIQGRAAEIA